MSPQDQTCAYGPLRVPALERFGRQLDLLIEDETPTLEQSWLAVDLTTIDDAARLAHKHGEQQLEAMLRDFHRRLALSPD